ncbi:amidohydrolase [Streptomyces sp. NPDC057565]|uniref:amidohydrolase n=1 Tax=Streptomyces sp. NPDC057565 TaxID=3346169 RepID=UPI00369288C5
MSEAPYTLVRARRVHTLADTGTEADAFVVAGDRILAVGDRRDLRALHPAAEPVDLGDGVVVPGLHDAHVHPTAIADESFQVDLSACTTPEEVAAALRDRAEATGAGSWVLATRYDHGKSTGGRVLDRDDLDRICPSWPVLVMHIAGHWAVANTRALELAGLTDHSVPPTGGSYGRDDAGRLNGVLYERTMAPFAVGGGLVPEPDLAGRLTALGAFLGKLNAAGLTSLCDTDVSPRGLRLLQEARDRGLLTARVGVLVNHDFFAAERDLGLRTGFGDATLRFVGVKPFLDGAVGGGTCLLEQPYEDGGGHGQQVLGERELERVLTVHEAGCRLAVHANGDRAIRLLLDAFERLQKASGRPVAGHRSEHCSLVDDEILARMRALGLIAVPFGSHVAFHGEKLSGYYGDRLSRMFAHRSLLDAGIAVAGSSDYPCGPYEPLLALQSCVTRQTARGEVLGGEQRITAAGALRLYTTGAALACGEERDKGRIAPGFLADFTVLADDPLRVPADQLSALPVTSTWLCGRQVWPRPCDLPTFRQEFRHDTQHTQDPRHAMCVGRARPGDGGRLQRRPVGHRVRHRQGRRAGRRHACCQG